MIESRHPLEPLTEAVRVLFYRNRCVCEMDEHSDSTYVDSMSKGSVSRELTEPVNKHL